MAPAVPGDWRKRRPPPVAITWPVTPGVVVAEAVTVGVASVAVAGSAKGVLVTKAATAGERVLIAGAVLLGPGLGGLAAVRRLGTAAGPGGRSSTPTKNATNASRANASAETINTNFRRGDIARILASFAICPRVGSVVFSCRLPNGRLTNASGIHVHRRSPHTQEKGHIGRRRCRF